MKRSTRRSISIALSMALFCNSMPVLAAGGGKRNYVAPNSTALVSDRLIVKFKANNLPKGLSVAQIRAQLSQPLTAQTVSQLQTAAGVALTEQRAIFNGAHVLSVAGHANRQTLNNAITGIRRLANVEYVEEDTIMTAQAVPDDSYYTTGPTSNPGLWGLWPATTVSSPAPGGTGSYGADFQTAWNTVTGTGVVVAVVDTGITPNVDIVGPGGTVAAGAGSNLVSIGYDFIHDCRVRGTTSYRGCAATTPAASAVVAASPDATDTGDYIDSTDSNTSGSIFFGWPTSNSSWHGTHVSGTIAALGNNAAGVIGGAYNAKILPVRVLGKGGGYLSDVAEGMMWAANAHPTIANPNPAKVINLSLGGTCQTPPCPCEATAQNAINAAVGAGAVVVVAAGNSNADVANFSPANCANVISVAAIARDGSRAWYSNFSSPASNTTNPTNVTLAAQGSDMDSYPATFDPGILSTLNTGTTTPVMTGGSTYNYYQGTSMATPHVVAAAALMLAKNPSLTPAQVKTILSAPSSLTAFPSFDPNLGWAAWDCATTQHCGAGILNANLAVQNSSPTVNAPATSDFGSVFINGTVNRTVTLTNTWLMSAQAGTATTNAAQFSIGTDTCSGSSIPPNGTCQITVSYSPAVSGAHTATLTVPITGAASPVLVGLSGTSVVQLTTSDVTAQTVAAGQSTTVNISYTNPNTTAVTTSAIILSQPSIMAASVDNCSNKTLDALANCTVTVTVTPATAGAYSGTASLGLSIGGAPAVATISGSANAAPAPAGGGGGGCSVMPFGANPDVSLLLAMLAVGIYWLRRRAVHARSAD